MIQKWTINKLWYLNQAVHLIKYSIRNVCSDDLINLVSHWAKKVKHRLTTNILTKYLKFCWMLVCVEKTFKKFIQESIL